MEAEGSGAVGNGEHSVESREIAMAALVLSSLKHQKLEPKTASTLQDLKTKFLAQHASTTTTTISNSNSINNIVQQPTKTLEKPLAEEEEEASHNNFYNGIIRNNSRNNISESIIMEIESYVLPKIPPIAKVKEIIGRCSIPFEKQLTASDVKEDQTRLTINKCYVKACLEPLLNDDEVPDHNGITVPVYDPKGDMYKMSIKNWSKVCVLSGSGWKHFVLRHHLKELQHFVTLWIFRHANTSELCVAITYRQFPGLSLPYKKNFNPTAHN